MLQLIGWLGCLYLVVKGLEFLSNANYRTPEGSLKGPATLGMVLAFLGASLFAIFFLLQGRSFPSAAPSLSEQSSSHSQSFRDCLKDPNTTSCNYEGR